MDARARRRLVMLLAGVLSASVLAACDEAGPGSVLEPVTGNVIHDASGTLEPIAGAEDTIHVLVPSDRVMGTIVETSAPIQLRYGRGRFDVVHSGFGGAFAALVPQVGTGAVRLLVQRSGPEPVEADYRVRVVAVNDAPEHGVAPLQPGSEFRREWVDPPLDRDVFDLELESGVEFFVELEPLDESVRLTAAVMPPGGSAGYYLFLEAGPELSRSASHTAAVSGLHRLVVYAAGLRPDVEAGYRFRVVVSGE